MARGEIESLREEKGFTLPELLATIAILGILVAIAAFIWLGMLESWRVEAATNQLVSDQRLAHERATNQLTDWRVVMVFGRGDKSEGPDYYLVKLDATYDSGDAPAVSERIPRTFPGHVAAKIVTTNSGLIVDDQDPNDYWVEPWNSTPTPVPDTRTIEFNSDGTMRFLPAGGGPSGSICVTVDDVPQNRISALSATSRVNVEYDSDCDTSTP